MIRSAEYAQERERLTADPIIRAMAAELPHGWADPQFTSWGFVSGASNEYHARGGRDDFSIGGPAEAIAAVYAELHAPHAEPVVGRIEYHGPSYADGD